MRRFIAGASLVALLLQSAVAQPEPGTVVDVRETIDRLLADEDTDGDRRITVYDAGDKRFEVGGRLVEGNARLGQLLQELDASRERGEPLDPRRLRTAMLPTSEYLSRAIRDRYWDDLTRTLDERGLITALADPKVDALGSTRIYVPSRDERALRYFRGIADARPGLGLEIIRLPDAITPGYVSSLDNRPGVLSLALRELDGGELVGVPFVVPGGRFNELYGWDSYFILLGLIADERIGLARGIVDNFVYQIEHYGKILNANRTYYLTRSQPPFLTAMALAVYKHLPPGPGRRGWLRRALAAAVIEYEDVWTSPPRLTDTGLSRYHGLGRGVPPEVPFVRYEAALAPLARSLGLTVNEMLTRYDAGELDSPELDEFFVHDRALRESGHDRTYRLIGRTTDLAPVALNSLLYRYETDLAAAIDRVFGGSMDLPGGGVTLAQTWRDRADRRRRLVNERMWDERRGLYLDVDIIRGERLDYVAATTLYPLWAGLAPQDRARRLRREALASLEAAGGLLTSDAASRGPVTPDRPLRQWDHPFGWAPHQMIAWEGLIRYGFEADARRLAYRWLYTIAMNAARFNGMIAEKYDVVGRTHEAQVTYGNVGVDFEYAPDGGFGWTNASFQIGLRLLTDPQRDALARLLPPEWTEERGPVP